jgi:hypothetical protein
MPRPIYDIAADVRANWPKVNYAALPYLEAMEYISKPSDEYGCEDGKTQVMYFLSNASGWRGDAAKRIKAELRSMLDSK